MITQHYMIDLIPAGDPLIVHASQYDKEARILAFDLYVGGVAFEMPAGATAQIRGTKPDDTVFSYAMDIDGTTVSIPIAQQMALVAGDVPCEIQITGDGSSHLGTANFLLRIERSALDEEAAESASDIPLFEQLVNEATEAAAEARTAAEDSASAQAAAEAAQSAAESLIPASGIAGQVLTKTTTGTSWEDPDTSTGGHIILDQEGFEVIPTRERVMFTGNVLVYDNQVYAATEVEITGGAGTGLKVTMTWNGSAYVTDHTYTEIVQNIDDGGNPYVVFDSTATDTFLQLKAVTSSYVLFGNPGPTGNALVYVYGTGAVTYTSQPFGMSTTVTVPASAWTNGQATISWGSITAACVVALGYPVSTTDADYQTMRDADIRVIGQASGNITVKALGTVPTTDLTFQLTRW